jgi:hypothetical protein
MERRQYLADAITDRQAEGETLAAIVRDELSATQVKELVDSGHLDEIPIDVGPPEETHATPDRDGEPSTMSERLDSDWGTPTDDHGVMTASPSLSSADDDDHKSNQTSQDAGQVTTQPASDEPSTEEATESERQADNDVETATVTHTAAETLDATSDGGSASATAGTEGTHSGPRTEEPPQQPSQPASGMDAVAGDAGSDHPHMTLLCQVEQLKANLSFFRNAISPVDETPDEKSPVVGLAEQTEAQCDQIIQQIREEMDVHRS